MMRDFVAAENGNGLV